ncbi:uncharacterized protein TNIN_12841 [Trichonephila inaurata madagascariensis]|uniref:Uncharacterized protein n=1 Tax=Trichonephila inaurata madagascariensis TaxID=2747483 RepID=A0A8X7CLP1_9ARAC|nr:uncharacterized protein TNIN_12841 [Trichonephila inaurata madagascariensis]
MTTQHRILTPVFEQKFDENHFRENSIHGVRSGDVFGSHESGRIHKPDIHGDSLPWETRLVNETNTAFSSMDYGPNNWGVHQRPLLKQVPSPSVPQLPPGPLQPLREYTSPNAPLHHMSPVGSPTSTTTLRAEWTIPGPPTKSRTGRRTYENGRYAVGAR